MEAGCVCVTLQVPKVSRVLKASNPCLPWGYKGVKENRICREIPQDTKALVKKSIKKSVKSPGKIHKKGRTAKNNKMRKRK